MVRRLLGKGGFGAVYLADVEGELKRSVALKVLHPEHAQKSRLVGKLRDEARILSLVRHRAIVQVQDLIRIDDGWCVVMEYVDGADVAAAVERGPLPPRAALEIAEEVAMALHAAGSQVGPDGVPLGLVHRDIKPSNIRITASGEVKVLDFGVARADFAGKEGGTFAAGVGTIPYMAVERTDGFDTPAGDVYALGVTLFEMLTGSLPGNSALSRERRRPGIATRAAWEKLASISEDVTRLVETMMALDPKDRISAREVARRCRDFSGRATGDALLDWAEVAVPVFQKAETPEDASVLRRDTRIEARASALSGPEAGGGADTFLPAAGSLDTGGEVSESRPAPVPKQKFSSPSLSDPPVRTAASGGGSGGAVLAGAAAMGLAVAAVAALFLVIVVVTGLLSDPEVAPASPPLASVAVTEAAPSRSPVGSPSKSPAGLAKSPVAGASPTAAKAASAGPATGTTTLSTKSPASALSPAPSAVGAPTSVAPGLAVPASVAPASAAPEPESTLPSGGDVVIEGPVVFTAAGSNGFSCSGRCRVAAGSYAGRATFTATGTEVAVSTFGVEEGGTRRIQCNSQFATCIVK